MTQPHLNTLSWRPPVFPLEIFDLIVKSLVDASDRLYPSPCSSDISSTLRACAVVCRSFHALCRPHLFREVEVGPTNPSARRRLAELIVTTPEISKYIRRLSYYRTTPFIFPGDTDIANLLPILRLPNVDTVSIRTVQSNHETRIRYYDDDGFRKFFDYFTSTSKLTTLHLHGVLGAPIFQILTAPRLKTLTVDSVMFSQWGPFFPQGRIDTSTSPRIRMTKFSMHETEFELAALSYFTDLEEVSFGYGWPAYLNYNSCQDNALYFPKLRALSVCNEFNPVLTICHAAKRAGITAFPNVNDVVISLETYKGNNPDVTEPTPSVFWYHLPALESVKIQLAVSRQSVRAYCLLRLDRCFRMCKSSLKRLCVQAVLSDPTHFRDVIQPLHYYLDLARGDNAIEVLDLPLLISPVPVPGDGTGTVRAWDFKSASCHVMLFQWLLTLLSDRTECGFPALRKVVVRVCFERGGSKRDELEGYRGYLVDALKRMTEADSENYPFFDWKVLVRAA